MILAFPLTMCFWQGAKGQKSQASTLCEPFFHPSGLGWVLGRPSSEYLSTSGLWPEDHDSLPSQSANGASLSIKQVECFCPYRWGTGQEHAAPGGSRNWEAPIC